MLQINSDVVVTGDQLEMELKTPHLGASLPRKNVTSVGPPSWEWHTQEYKINQPFFTNGEC